MYEVTTPRGMGESDRYMMETLGIPGMVLMENAAQAVTLRVLEALKQRPGHVAVLCGGGNNGGDGLAVLRQLAMRGIPGRGALLCAPERLRGDARANYEMARRCGLEVAVILTRETLEEWWSGASVIVDALLGTGLDREIQGLYARTIELANAADAWRIAVDIPSGVQGGDGRVLGTALRAHETVTFQFAKRGHLLFPGREYTGRLIIAPIGPLARPVDGQPREAVLERADAAALLPPRAPSGHKGDSGRGLLIAGSPGYSGAARMSAGAALRCGCGLTTVLTPRGVCPMLSNLYEAIVQPASQREDWDASSPAILEATLCKATAVAIGPGLGGAPITAELVRLALCWGGPLTVDADGLNALSRSPELLPMLHERVVLTPHPGEMARLTGKNLTEITGDPVGCARAAAMDWGCVVLLKGATSVIAAPDGQLTYNLTGGPGLAKGGSGDVLTGILLALLCQGHAPYEAAQLGAYLLGRSAQEAMELLHSRVLLAGDVIDAIGVTVHRPPVCDMIDQ